MGDLDRLDLVQVSNSSCGSGSANSVSTTGEKFHD